MVKWKENKIPKIDRRVYLCSAVPVGITTALDIAASNASYIYVSIPFYTIVKSSAVIFVLFFSILYKLQPMDTSLIFSAVIISRKLCNLFMLEEVLNNFYSWSCDGGLWSSGILFVWFHSRNLSISHRWLSMGSNSGLFILFHSFD